MRPSLGCHFQELDKRSDILLVGVHDDPICNGGKLHITTDVAVLGITKKRISRGGGNELLQPNSESVYNDSGQGGSGALMRSSVVRRSVVIDGHKTSVSLEDLFWTDAHAQQMTLSALVAKIDGAREQSNLSSAIRLFVLHHFRNENERMDVAKAHLSTVGAERRPAS